ncbi:MAG: hypothetical protein Q9160_007691 [Pyrenula sp. 1 TL-2023]
MAIPSEEIERYFVLPKLKAEYITNNEKPFQRPLYEACFSNTTVAWAIQNGMPLEDIRAYVQRFDEKKVKSLINAGVRFAFNDEFAPLLFFAVERGEEKIVTLMVKARASLSEVSKPRKIPILEFTILFSSLDQTDTTDMFKLLLSLGANPNQIPRDMWIDPLKTPKHTFTPAAKDIRVIDSWCTPKLRVITASNFNLSQRYFCKQADLLPQPSKRKCIASESLRMSDLFCAPYHIVGQRRAIERLQASVIAKLLQDNSSPLVLVFTGPSGHGKTELARSMGKLLKCKMLVIDCTNIKHDTDLFGPLPPYKGYEKGSNLNNFLAKHAETSTRNIVFLDEFEKTTDEVWDALLPVWDKAMCIDRREPSNNTIHCKNTIWICASNQATGPISGFFEEHLRNGSSETRQNAPYKELGRNLKESFKWKTSSPLVGRIAAVIPFFPFTEEEQAVVAHKILLEEARRARCPIDVEKPQLYGDFNLHIKDDGPFSKSIAHQAYNPELGARSLANLTSHHIINPIIELYLKDDEPCEPRRSERAPLPQISMKLASDSAGQEHVKIYKDGFIEMRWKKIRPTKAIEGFLCASFRQL